MGSGSHTPTQFIWEYPPGLRWWLIADQTWHGTCCLTSVSRCLCYDKVLLTFQCAEVTLNYFYILFHRKLQNLNSTSLGTVEYTIQSGFNVWVPGWNPDKSFDLCFPRFTSSFSVSFIGVLDGEDQLRFQWFLRYQWQFQPISQSSVNFANLGSQILAKKMSAVM